MVRSRDADTVDGEVVLARAVAAYQAAFGSRLVAGYALGSLAHGGFSRLVSDVDLGLILRDPVRLSDRRVIRAVAASVAHGGPALADRLSVFWGTPATLAGRARGGRFPPLDRLDLLDSGRLLTGLDTRDTVARPGQAQLLAGGAEFALGYLAGDRDLPRRLRDWARRRPGGDAVREIRTPPLLASRGPRRITKIVLFPVRFLYTARTGRAGLNSLAAEHYLSVPDAPGKALVAAAVRWRWEAPAGGEAAALLGPHLIPLYIHYIDDHIGRLDASGYHRLARRFRAWRQRLLR